MKCPHFKCEGETAEGANEHLVVCPQCHRVSARCLWVNKQKACATLNRALSHYCRQCGKELGAGWAQSTWARDTGGPSGEHTLARENPDFFLHLAPAEEVLNLQPWLGTNLENVWPIEVVETSGRLWLGASDGRFFLVEPFADRTRPPTLLHSDQLWSGKQSRLRACESGVWMTMFATHGIWAMNLLPLDDPRKSGLTPTQIWQAKPGQRLAADPVLLPNPAADSPITAHERLLIWLTEEGQDVVLYFKPLCLDASRDVPVRMYRLNPEKFKGLGLAGKERAILLAAPFGNGAGCLLITRQCAWLFDPFAAEKKLTRLANNGREPHPKTHQGDIPGAVFLKGQAASDGSRTGRLFLCNVNDAREELLSLTIAPTGIVGRTEFSGYAGLPLDTVDLEDVRGVLCLADHTLSLCDELGRPTRVGSSDFLNHTTRGHVYGRLAVCSGTVQGQDNQFAVLMDLTDRRLFTQHTWTGRATHPLLIGSYLFTVETAEPQGDLRSGTIRLARRRLSHRSPAAEATATGAAPGTAGS